MLKFIESKGFEEIERQGLKKLSSEKNYDIDKIIMAFAIKNDFYMERSLHHDLIMTEMAYPSMYTFYTTNALVKTNNLTNEIAKKSPYVEMITNIQYQDFSIKLNGFVLINIYNLTTNLLDFCKSCKLDMMKISEYEIQTIPFILSSINDLRNMYSLADRDKWDSIRDNMDTLDMTDLKIKSIRFMKTYIKSDPVRNINYIIDNFVLKNSDYILVGAAAINPNANIKKQILCYYVMEFVDKLRTNTENIFNLKSVDIINLVSLIDTFLHFVRNLSTNSIT
jgi:hypothetical protein